MWLTQSCSAMRAREWESTPGRIWSIISTTLTLTPHMSARATAASRPMKPPPTITASLIFTTAEEELGIRVTDLQRIASSKVEPM